MKLIKRHSVKLYLALAVAGVATLYLWPALVAAMPLTARHNLERAFLGCPPGVQRIVVLGFKGFGIPAIPQAGRPAAHNAQFLVKAQIAPFQ